MPPKTSSYDLERDYFYRSPAGVIDALLRHVRIPPGTVWEEAASDGALAELIKDAGRIVIVADLVDRGHPAVTPRVDFLLERKVPPGVVTLVTKLPYDPVDRFVRHAIDLSVPMVAMLMKVDFIWRAAPVTTSATRSVLKAVKQ